MTSLKHYDNENISAQTLLLLHPGGVLHSVWLPFIREWSSHYRIIAPDFDAFDQIPFSTERLARAVIELMEQKHVTSTAIIGSSLGANVALQIVLLNPSMVTCLVADSAQAGGEHLPFVVEKLIALLSLAARVVPGSLYVRLIKSQFTTYSPNDWEAIRREMSRVGMYGFFKSIQATFSHDVQNRLGQIHVPVLLTNGIKDPVLPGSKKLLKGLPQAEHDIIDEAGHSAFLSQPDAFLQKAAEFIQANR